MAAFRPPDGSLNSRPHIGSTSPSFHPKSLTPSFPSHFDTRLPTRSVASGHKRRRGRTATATISLSSLPSRDGAPPATPLIFGEVKTRESNQGRPRFGLTLTLTQQFYNRRPLGTSRRRQAPSTYRGELLKIHSSDSLPHRIGLYPRVLRLRYKMMNGELESDQLPQLRGASADLEVISNRFEGVNCGLLHGRMKSDEKDEALRCFRSGETQILLSTQVIEELAS